jgi:ankyrin repeat protein
MNAQTDINGGDNDVYWGDELVRPAKITPDSPLGLSIDFNKTALEVTNVKESGQCFKQGVRDGQILTAINGRSLSELKVETSEDFCQILKGNMGELVLYFKVPKAAKFGSDITNQVPLPSFQPSSPGVRPVGKKEKSKKIGRKSSRKIFNFFRMRKGQPPLVHKTDTELHIAVQNEGEQEVLVLLQQGADFAAENALNETPFHLAAGSGLIRHCDAIIQQANSQGIPLSALSRKSSSKNVTERLIGHGNHPPQREKMYPVTYAAKGGHLETVLFLLKRYSENESAFVAEDLESALYAALLNGKLDIAQHILMWGAPYEEITKNRNVLPEDSAKFVHKFSESIANYRSCKEGREKWTAGEAELRADYWDKQSDDAKIEVNFEYPVRSINWVGRPFDSAGSLQLQAAAAFGAIHTALEITLDCSKLGLPNRVMLLERAETGGRCFNDIALSNCPNLRKHRFSRDFGKMGGVADKVKNYWEMEPSQLKKGTTLRDLYQTALTCGPYHISKSNCHHMCFKVWNEYCVPECTVPEKDIPNKDLYVLGERLGVL